MDAALRILGYFFLLDVLAGALLVLLVAVLRCRQPTKERTSVGSLVGALIFLAIIMALIYAGIWLCLRTGDAG